MKYTKYIIACAFIIAVLCMEACSKKGGDLLDRTESGTINEQVTFSDSIRTMEFLTGLYQGVQNYYKQTVLTNYGSMADCTDEGEIEWTGTSNYPVPLNLGTLNSSYSWVSGAWSHWFSRIRNANIYLKNIATTPLSAPMKERTKAEARFMRAWYYHQLFRFFGGVPLVGDTVYTADDIISRSRNTVAETIDYIVKELDGAAEGLPTEFTGADYGRATRGAALALKARTLLYAASPLFNGGYDGQNGFTASTEAQKLLVCYPSYDANRWKTATDAFKAVIDLNKYSLYEDNTTALGYGFYKVFHLRVSSEAIFQMMDAPNTRLEGMWLPPTRSGAGASYPSQQLVDAFPMKDGKAITDATSGYNPADPYINRDPRFYYSIIYNGAMFRQTSTVTQAPIYTYFLAPTDGMGVSSYTTRSGYYCRKMLNNESTGNTQRCIPEIRYAEVLLSYAEALNEVSGPSAEVYSAVEAIRKRAGLVPYTLPTGLTKDAMRKYIWNERRIELAYENHRYFDTRRWKIANDPEVVIFRGIKWTKNGTTYKREDIVADARSFNHPAMYFFPIPQTEIGRQKLFIQNPGY
ncbi:MAG: RagB/SusD family nutrient uptake outer membrane protein [Chitinophagaceae bacterium]